MTLFWKVMGGWGFGVEGERGQGRMMDGIGRCNVGGGKGSGLAGWQTGGRLC